MNTRTTSFGGRCNRDDQFQIKLGRDAYGSGLGLRDNPYKHGTSRYQLWNIGWNERFDTEHSDTSHLAESIFGRLGR